MFGIARELVGQSKLTLEKVPHTVNDLKQLLFKEYPELSRLASVAVAVDTEYAEDSTVLSNKSEVAIIPPVSGG